MSECLRQQETLEIVRSGRWPHGCDEEVRTHVSACTDCTESVQIASLLRDDYRAAVRTAPVPGSGLMWWRVQRRAREEAARNAARLMTLVQGICVFLGVAVALAIAGTDNLSHALSLAPSMLAHWSLPLLVAFLAWVTVAPVAVYLVVSRD